MFISVFFSGFAHAMQDTFLGGEARPEQKTLIKKPSKHGCLGCLSKILGCFTGSSQDDTIPSLGLHSGISDMTEKNKKFKDKIQLNPELLKRYQQLKKDIEIKHSNKDSPQCFFNSSSSSIKLDFSEVSINSNESRQSPTFGGQFNASQQMKLDQ